MGDSFDGGESLYRSYLDGKVGDWVGPSDSVICEWGE